ncbi:hypothetical protein [Clostridium pasteurianum]|uniref:Uncharacterized protein n=1 Tax=Clostridium pasteurianum BC1 TaxID=86416 RepID=R4K479_CLOPA|nr:hypothetical protein [Clostridium pasteurianum]AGK97952.1 hypothetical protein Clopa_3137 [Clostridium pasteurianum BC1]
MGFDSYDIMCIIEDIIFNNKPYLMNKKLLDKTFKNIRSIAGKTYLPVHKYVKGLNISIDSLPKEWHIINSISDVTITTNDKNYADKHKKYYSIKEIEKSYPTHIPKQLSNVLVNIEYISIEELEDYLKKIYRDENYMKKSKSTVKKLAAAYDYLKYGS